MAIKKIREILSEKQLSTTNVDNLPITPKMQGDDLQKVFDQDVENLIEAIDSDDGGLISSIASNITQAGGGDMSMDDFATSIDPDDPPSKPYPVDYALKADADGNGNNIASTYLPKTGGTVSGNLTVQGLQLGGHPRVADNNPAEEVDAAQTEYKIAEITGLSTNGLYLVNAYWSGRPKASGGGRTWLYIFGDSNAVVVQTFDNARNDTNFAQTLTCVIVAPTTVSLRITTPNAFGYENMKIRFDAVRLA